MKRFYPSEDLREVLEGLGVARAKHDVVSLGEMMPSYVKIEGRVIPVTFRRTDRQWGVSITGYYQPTSNKEADVRAKMMVYILENNIEIL